MPALSKSRFTAGFQCHNLLWWMVHEPEAPEVQLDPAIEDRLAQGQRVGELAPSEVPGGVLIDLPWRDFEGRIRATEEALAAGAPAVYEVAFAADGVFVAVDILERTGDGFTLIEVKSSNSLQDKHIPDVEVQTHVLRDSDLYVPRQELMHLNGECRYPDLSNLFVREDVTERVAEILPQVPAEIEAQLAMLEGPFPGRPFGTHCPPREGCPFHARCSPEVTADHLLTLYRLKIDRKLDLRARGIESIRDLDTYEGLSALARRQVEAVRRGARIVDDGLARALEPFSGRLAFLDFETVAMAVPVWGGCRPWEAMPVQFSVHRETEARAIEHREFLSGDGEDCRPELARALVAASAYKSLAPLSAAIFLREFTGSALASSTSVLPCNELSYT